MCTLHPQLLRNFIYLIFLKFQLLNITEFFFIPDHVFDKEHAMCVICITELLSALSQKTSRYFYQLETDTCTYLMSLIISLIKIFVSHSKLCI